MEENVIHTNEKRVKRKHIVAIIMLLLANLMVFLTIWLLSKYDQISLDQVIFQMKTSAAGANSNLMNSAYIRVGVFGVVSTIIQILAYKRLKVEVDRWAKEQNYFKVRYVRIAKYIRERSFKISLWCLIVSLVFFIIKLEVGRWVTASMTNSLFIEGYYVNPEDVEIRFPREKRNLIYIFLESMENTYAEPGVGEKIIDDYIPELTQLREKNISFGGGLTYTGSTWTAAAMMTQTCGTMLKVPLTAENYGGDEEFVPGVISIGEILQKQGYTQTLLIGSDGEFAERESYFSEHGNYKIVDIKSLKAEGRLDEDYKVWWGFEDEKLFQYAKEELSELGKSGQPFNFTMLTADTHFPDGYWCPQCEEIYEEQYANVLRCSSKQVYEFIEWIKDQPFYKNTTIVISGDHLTMDPAFLEDIDENYTRTVYNCIINSAVQPEMEGERKFATFDMFPTTLAAMGCRIEGNRLGLGTNLFSDVETLTEMFGFERLDQELQKNSEFYNEELLEMPPEIDLE